MYKDSAQPKGSRNRHLELPSGRLDFISCLNCLDNVSRIGGMCDRQATFFVPMR